MLSPQVQERIAPPANLFYCDCKHDCIDSFILPPLVVDMLMSDPELMLLIGKHTSERAGEIVKRGKGWKVCKAL